MLCTMSLVFPRPHKTLLQLLGPSVVFVALSLNGGEMLLWPNLVGNYGLSILWPIPLILLLQYLVNLEIERYTMVKGVTAIKGIIGLVPMMKYLFIVSIVLSLMWPAWVSIAGNMLATTVGVPNMGAWFAIAMMISILFIWKSPQSYSILENVTKIGLAGVLLISLLTLIQSFFTYEALEITPAFFPVREDRFLFVSALAFGGVAGVLNLVQSDWIAGEGYGIFALREMHSPHAERDSGKHNIADEVDWTNPASKMHWKEWWSLVQREHAVLFYGGNLLGIGIIALVAFATIGGAGYDGFALLTYQVETFGSIGQFWALGIIVLFLMAQVTILDAAGRLLKDAMNLGITKSQSAQLIGVFGLVILCITALIPSFNQPAGLLQISAILSAASMGIYPIILVRLNMQLPEPVRPSRFRRYGVYATAVFYLFSLLMLI